MSKPVRFGILGGANIARQFVAGCQPSGSVEIAAIASRSLDRAEAMAGELGIGKAIGSYEGLLADPDIEVIYLPLPNSLHAEWAIKAVQAGKHVLCEKPLAMDAAQVREMFAAADKAGVFLREGYPYMAQPQTLMMRQLLLDGAIGAPKVIRSTFSVTFNDPANIRLSPILGGGALYDAGSYAVSLIRIVAGKRPNRVQATAQVNADGVDMTTVANFEFDDGLYAQMSCSFAAAYLRSASVSGEAGVLETNYLNHPPLGGPAILQIRRGIPMTTPLETIAVPDGNGFRLEAEAFAGMVRGAGEWGGATPEESLDIALILDAVRASAKSGNWETVG